MGKKRDADNNSRRDEKRKDNQFEEVFHVHTIPHYLLYRKLFLHVLDGAIALYNLRHNLLNTNELRRRGGGSLVTPLRLRTYNYFLSVDREVSENCDANHNSRRNDEWDDDEFDDVFHVHTIPYFFFYCKELLRWLHGAIA